MTPSDVVQDAKAQAASHGKAVKVDRIQFHHLLRAKGDQGESLVSVSYDRVDGLCVHFMGKPIVWQHLS